MLPQKGAGIWKFLKSFFRILLFAFLTLMHLHETKESIHKLKQLIVQENKVKLNSKINQQTQNNIKINLIKMEETNMKTKINEGLNNSEQIETPKPVIIS